MPYFLFVCQCLFRLRRSEKIQKSHKEKAPLRANGFFPVTVHWFHLGNYSTKLCVLYRTESPWYIGFRSEENGRSEACVLLENKLFFVPFGTGGYDDE